MKKIILVLFTLTTILFANAQESEIDSISTSEQGVKGDVDSNTELKVLSKAEKLDDYYHRKKSEVLYKTIASWETLKGIAETEVVAYCKIPLKFNGIESSESAGRIFENKGYTSFSLKGERTMDRIINHLYTIYDGKNGTNGLALKIKKDVYLSEDLKALEASYFNLIKLEYINSSFNLLELIYIQEVLEMLTSLKYRNNVCHFRYFNDAKKLFEIAKSNKINSKADELKENIISRWSVLFDNSSSLSFPGNKEVIVSLKRTRGMLEEISYKLVKRNSTY